VLLVPSLVPSFQIDVDEAMRTFISPWKFSVFAGLKLPQSDLYGSRGVEILGSGRLPGLIGEAQEGWGSRGDCQTPILERRLAMGAPQWTPLLAWLGGDLLQLGDSGE
jgi:hypothetical protein